MVYNYVYNYVYKMFTIVFTIMFITGCTIEKVVPILYKNYNCRGIYTQRGTVKLYNCADGAMLYLTNVSVRVTDTAIYVEDVK